MTKGEKIKKCRLERGLTQKKLGELCGMSEAQIGQYENGYREPKRETLEKIVLALEVPLTYFFSSDWKQVINKQIPIDDKDYNFAKYLTSLGFYLFEDKDTTYNYLQYQNKEVKLSKEETKNLKHESDAFIKFKIEQLFKEHSEF